MGLHGYGGWVKGRRAGETRVEPTASTSKQIAISEKDELALLRMTKVDLVWKILRELRRAQEEQWSPPPSGPATTLDLPPVIWVGDGRAISATRELIEAVRNYSQIVFSNQTQLKSRFKFSELNQIVERCFALVLSDLDLDDDDDILIQAIQDRVAFKIDERLRVQETERVLTLGCHLIEGASPYPIVVGPVIFETRESWRQRMLIEGKLSKVTARRLDSRWRGKRLRRRRASLDTNAEHSIVKSIDRCPIVCSIATKDLSWKNHQEKGLIAGRLALTALSLLWARPSEGLRWLRLLYDRSIARRFTASFGSGNRVAINDHLAEFPAGRYSDPDLVKSITENQWLLDTIGLAINGFVKPNAEQNRQRMLETLFLSVWWYHEACREQMDQFATTKFVSSMDALAHGGKAKAIIRLIETTLGKKADEALMQDGRTTANVVNRFYDHGRSRLIHGSSEDFAHDWNQMRSDAEVIGRHLLIACCRWIFDYPSAKSLMEIHNTR